MSSLINSDSTLQFQQMELEPLLSTPPIMIITSRPTTATTGGPDRSSNLYCEICGEKKDPRDMLRLTPCSHSFCSDCISNHVAARLRSNATVVPCPGLRCRRHLELVDIHHVLPPDVVARWDDMLCEALILASETFYCPFEDCSAIMVREEEDGALIRDSECPECHRLFCARCRVGWHAGIRCEELEQSNGGRIADPGQSSACFCDICTDNKDPRDMLHLPPCFHSFCSDCISNHVAARLQSNTTVVPCPALDCGGLLEFADIAAVLPAEVAARWDEMLCEALIPASEKFYCPYKDCSAMMVRDEENVDVITESECPECHRLFCARCRVGWHVGIGCDELEKLNEDERGREDLMVREMAKRQSWMRCPNCKFYVDKTQGCLHMTCRCGFQFCYACGVTWAQHHGGCRP